MKPSHDLFDLVKSLTKTEKRYVSLFLSTSFHGSNKISLQLFRAISKQENYDEAALKKQMAKFFPKHFSAEKNKLFELILESMLFYYRDRTEEKKISALRYNAGFLFSKSLRPAGWRYLNKAIALSESHEAFASGILLAYRKNLEVRKSAPGEVQFSPVEFHAHNQQLLQSLGEDLTLYTLYTEMTQLEKRYGSTSGLGDGMHSFEQIIHHPLMNPEKKLHAFSSQLCRLEILAIYHKITGNDQLTFDCCNEQVKLYEASPARIAYGYGRYSDALLNRLQSAVVLKQHDTFDKLLPQTKKALDEIKKYLGYNIDFINFYGPESLELISLMNRADNKRGPTFLAYFEKRFKQYRAGLREEERVSMLYMIGTYYFYLGNFKKALAFYNDLIDSTSPDFGQNFQCMVRVAKLLLHYDMGHIDLLPSLTTSLSRLLNKHGRLGPFEKRLLAFFSKEPEPGNKAQLKILYATLQKLAPHPYNYGRDCEFDLKAWVESRLGDQPLQEVVARNSNA